MERFYFLLILLFISNNFAQKPLEFQLLTNEKKIYLPQIIKLRKTGTNSTIKKIDVFFNNIQLDKVINLDSTLDTIEYKFSVDKNLKTINPENLAFLDDITINFYHKNQRVFTLDDTYTVVFDENYETRKTIVVLLFILMFSMLLIAFGNNREISFSAILRDRGNNNQKIPFSLSKTQLVFWTFIIVASLIYIWLMKDKIPILNANLLALLGVSTGTSAAAALIDHNDMKDENILLRHQNDESDGFIMDILSDENGLSIHRLQQVIFTLFFGAYVLYGVLINVAIPDLGEKSFILMGISSSGYLGLKLNENKLNSDGVKG